MKLLINILFVFTFLFMGCSKDSDSPSEVSLSVDLTKMELSGGGESKVITVTTDAVWKAVCPEADTTWCTLAIEGNKLTVTALANASEKTRTTQITISAEGATSCRVEVSQKPSAFPGLPAEITLAVSGKEQSFIVLTQRKLTFSKPGDASWCTVTIVGNEVYFSAVKNTGTTRQTVVTISDGVESANVTVKQRMPSDAKYAVGDLFKENGEVTGIVAYVNEEGWGFVLALDELTAGSLPSPYWGHYAVYQIQISTTRDDGQKNMDIWRAQPSKESFRAFQLCENKNKNGAKDWFLASKDEWLSVYSGISAYGLEKFNKVLETVPNSKPMVARCYWSSTESTSLFYNADFVNFLDGTTGEEFKVTDTKCSIRAIRKFE